MQGSIENELAIARMQLLNLLREQQNVGSNPILEKVEESTIVQQGKTEDKIKVGGALQEKEKLTKEKLKEKLFQEMVRSAKACGEEYDPDGDDVYLDDPEPEEEENEDEDENKEHESSVFSRKRIYERRDYLNEYIRLTALIARLEQQLIQSMKMKAEIEIIRKGDKQVDGVEQLTDTELDRELQEAIEGLSI